MDAKDKKDRKNVNVSLRKRDKDLLNDILNSWCDDGYNLSNEVCDAIILKNLSNTNPHIQTILSTLSLIESSLKSHFAAKGLKEEDINQRALEIFNEVITIDIDGNKLTNLIKGVGIGIAGKNTNSKTKDNPTQSSNEKNIKNKEKIYKEQSSSNNNDAENIFESSTENVTKYKQDEEKLNQDTEKVKEIKNIKEVKEEVEEDIFSAYTMQSGFSN